MQVQAVALPALICLSLLATFSVSGAQVPISSVRPGAPYLPVPEHTPPQPEARMAPLRLEAQEPPPPGTGLILPPMDLSHLTGQKMPGCVRVQSLPNEFDWRDKNGSNYVTPAKDQASCGSCYAFGTIGAFEAKLLIDGAGTFDFSENHAKECNWREMNDFQYPNPGDYWGSCDGGNTFMLASLFSQAGTVLEACDPHKDYDVECRSTCPYQKTLLDWRIINGGVVPNSQVLKQYIYDNGPVITSMYADSGQGFNSSYDGSYTFSYTAPGDNINHGVLIVGWSDDLPPISGGTDPAAGWIVKNSWGTDWGDHGYFYIAYGAANIGTSSSFVHDWQDYDPDGDIWYYDEDGWWGSWGFMNRTAWGLARFVSNSDTNVRRVEFWTTDATSDVDVYVYDEFDGSTLSTKLAEVLDNSYGEAGYHSVELSSPVPVNSGDDVVAVVKFTNEGFGYPIATDPHGMVETGRTYMSFSGSGWIDMGTTHDTDVAIRLRTDSSTPVVLDRRAYLPLVLRHRLSSGREGLTNGDFEDGPSAWTWYSTHGWNVIVTDFPGSVAPHSGNWAAWLGGEHDDISLIQQQVTVPPDSPYLAYWHWVASADVCGFDLGRVVVNDTVVADQYYLCQSESTRGWVKHTVDLSSYAGQSIGLQIRVETNGSLKSNLFVDDLSFQASASAPEVGSGLLHPNDAVAQPGTGNTEGFGTAEAATSELLFR